MHRQRVARRTVQDFASSGDAAALRRELAAMPAEQKDYAVNNIGSGYGTPLCVACEAGHLDCVEVLLEHGSQVNRSSHSGLSPLHAAASAGAVLIIDLLLDKQAAIDARTEHTGTALHHAAVNGHAAVIDLLGARKADVEARDGSGCQALHRAVLANKPTAVEALLSTSANVNAQDTAGCSPLHYAAATSNTALTSLLLSRGGNRLLRDKSRRTPEQVARTEPIRFLIRTHNWVWTVHEHNSAPAAFKRMVHTLLLVRTFELSSAFSLIPNELLFLILAFTPPF